MRLNASALIIGALATGVLAGCANTGDMAGRSDLRQASAQAAPLATPPGVTVQLSGTRNFTLIIGYAIDKGRHQTWTYADADGMTLYTSDDDNEPGKSSCYDQCAERFPPFIAAPGAEPVGDWSLVAREDGTTQWALRGKPLYRFSKDSEISDDYGRDVDGVWNIAEFSPSAGIDVPPGFGIREIPDANGHVLVSVKGMALYSHMQSEQSECLSSDPCRGSWTPYAAPVLAIPTGDFSTVKREDGILQWAYKGQPLYTYDEDLEVDYANGIGVDESVRAAMLVRYFRPPNVTFQPTPGQGIVLADENGLTLYRRDAYVYQLGGHGLRRGIGPRAVVGRDIGTSMAGCDARCQDVWIPFAAPDDAQPSGHWTVLMRDDGSKQWAYKSYALYRFAGDSKPGDLMGNDFYNFTISDNPQVASTRPSRMTAAGAMYWIYAYP